MSKLGRAERRIRVIKFSRARYFGAGLSFPAHVGFMDAFKRLTFWLLEGTKGGPTRIRLLSFLEKKPMNLNQLSKSAGLDYKSVEHHIGLLEKNGLIEPIGEGYGKAYAISDSMLAEKEMVQKIRGATNGKAGKNKGK